MALYEFRIVVIIIIIIIIIKALGLRKCIIKCQSGGDWAVCQPGIFQVGRLVRRPGGLPRQMLKEEVERGKVPRVLNSRGTALFG